jgi:hypothetical protein
MILLSAAFFQMGVQLFQFLSVFVIVSSSPLSISWERSSFLFFISNVVPIPLKDILGVAPYTHRVYSNNPTRGTLPPYLI